MIYRTKENLYKGLPWWGVIFIFVLGHIPVWHKNPNTGKKSIKFLKTASEQEDEWRESQRRPSLTLEQAASMGDWVRIYREE